jgi:mitogen-activated protein kinase 1/3
MREELFGVSGAWAAWQLSECLLFGVRIVPVWWRVGPGRLRALVEQRLVGWNPAWNSELKHLDDQHLAALRDTANRHFPRLTEIAGCLLEDVTPNVDAFSLFVVENITKTLEADSAQDTKNMYAIEDDVIRVDKQYKIISRLTDITYGRCYRGEMEITATAVPMEVEGTARQVVVIVMRDAISNETAARRLIRDLTLLRMMDSPFVLSVEDMMTISPADKETFMDVVFVTNRLDASLHDLIVTGRLANDNDAVKALCYGIVRGLMYIHSAKVVHRDLTPKSYLVAMNPWEIKLCEFGLARPVARDGSIQKNAMKLSYRAPEVIVDRLVYGFPMDLWSAGLVMAEMFTGRPFVDFVIDDLANQIEMVVKLVGTPTDEQINRIADPTAKEFVKKLPRRPRAVRAKLVADGTRRVIPDSAQQLIDSLVVWGPSARPSAIQCLKSPYFEDIRQIETELESSVVVPPQFDFEVVRMPSPANLYRHLRALITSEVDLYHLVE